MTQIIVKASNMMRSGNGLVKRTYLLLLGILLAVILLEVALRLFGPYQRAGKTPGHVLWQPDPEIGFVPAANLTTTYYSNI